MQQKKNKAARVERDFGTSCIMPVRRLRLELVWGHTYSSTVVTMGTACWQEVVVWGFRWYGIHIFSVLGLVVLLDYDYKHDELCRSREG